jgi:site-specific DNA-methyltransferase (adenine-specific)
MGRILKIGTYETNQIIHGDSYEIVPTLPDKSFDTVILDPNYGMGIDWWDTPLDVAFFTEQVERVGREFYAVFGQMPYIREWDREAEKQGFQFLEHISWIKRDGNPGQRLTRTHEDIYIYAIGNNKKFYSTKGPYQDVKCPGVLFDVVSIEAMNRHISDLHGQLKGKADGVMTDNRKCHKTYERYASMTSVRAPELANYSNVWSFMPENKRSKGKNKKVHATVKPLPLVKRLVEMLTPEGGSVTDWGSGYGTTALACQRLERLYLCIEKVGEFHRESIERLKNDVWQPDLKF